MISVIGKKIGMTRIYNDKGVVIPVTLIQIYDSCVSEINGSNVVLSYDKPKNPEKKLSKSLLGYYKKKNLEPYSKKKSVKIDGEFKIGDIINASILKDVENVDVSGNSKGKGFAGAMKRHGFAGLEAQHGVSISHRSLGSTGNRMSPSKVFAGKKMPGQMGNSKVTVKNLKIVDIDIEENTICVKGAVPGANNSDVVIKGRKK